VDAFEDAEELVAWARRSLVVAAASSKPPTRRKRDRLD
jgi:hypothetical protein